MWRRNARSRDIRPRMELAMWKGGWKGVDLATQFAVLATQFAVLATQFAVLMPGQWSCFHALIHLNSIQSDMGYG